MRLHEIVTKKNIFEDKNDDMINAVIGLSTITGGLSLWAGAALTTSLGVSLVTGSLLSALAIWRLYSDYKKLKSHNFSVFVNGKKTKSDLNYHEAETEIKRLAVVEHNPNTYYTIFDNNLNKVVWRFKIGDPIEERVKR